MWYDVSLPKNKNTKFGKWYKKEVMKQTDDEQVRSMINSIKSNIEQAFEYQMQKSDNDTSLISYHFRIWCKKPLSNENDNNSNENDAEGQLSVFITNPSDRYWFSHKETERWVCKYEYLYEGALMYA